MSIIELLSNAGLPEREVKIYLSLLELGTANVTSITKKAGIERTYGYDILDSLIAKKLIEMIEVNGKRKYCALDPKNLEISFIKRLELVKEALPELSALYQPPINKSTIQFLSGKSNLIALYSEIEKGSTFDFIGDINNPFSVLAENFFLSRQLTHNKVKVRELIGNISELPERCKAYSPQLQEARALPQINLTNDLIILENKVVVISYQPEIELMITENQASLSTQKAYFEYMWQATPPLSQW